MSLVECCGEFYIVNRLLEENTRKRKAGSLYANLSVWNAKTVSFKVYKFDDEIIGTMVEVESLGDNAFVMATDTCFSVLANNEFYGCLKNFIYFTENNEIKVLDNGTDLYSMKTSRNYCCGDLRFVECCGELYIVERLLKEHPRKRKVEYGFGARTVGFKVYKMDNDDKELGKWVEVKSLGDNAFVIATDTCFSVLAHEFYGCLKNSIYFIEYIFPKVFKLDNGNGGSIAVMSKYSQSDQSCFQMFVPSFL